MVTKVTSVELSVPDASTPRAVLAPDASVAPVPPSETAKVPVIADALKSKANLVDSKTNPPLFLVSTAKV